MLSDYGYIEKAIANIRAVAEKQEANIKAAAKLMADAIAESLEEVCVDKAGVVAVVDPTAHAAVRRY
ncbi:MAG: hypothetical protein IJ658_07570 [Kiritimatiellae bacterium]|nr:hypothetical protein [Kiritimatiellia bacterium]